jgi:[ribosomal protein S5]-alanine N-acetyltransferase
MLLTPSRRPDLTIQGGSNRGRPDVEAVHNGTLALRQLQIHDAPELARISDTRAVSQWMSFMEGGFPLEKAEALIASQNDTKEYFFSMRLFDGTLIGAMGVIDHPDGTIEVGYWFGVEYQGRGYASEALRANLNQIAADPDLAHRSIFAECRPDNAASIRLLTKTGFYATGRPGPRPNRTEFALR